MSDAQENGLDDEEFDSLSTEDRIDFLKNSISDERAEREKINQWIANKLRSTLQNMSEAMKKSVAELYEEIDTERSLRESVEETNQKLQVEITSLVTRLEKAQTDASTAAQQALDAVNEAKANAGAASDNNGGGITTEDLEEALQSQADAMRQALLRQREGVNKRLAEIADDRARFLEELRESRAQLEAAREAKKGDEEMREAKRDSDRASLRKELTILAKSVAENAAQGGGGSGGGGSGFSKDEAEEFIESMVDRILEDERAVTKTAFEKQNAALKAAVTRDRERRAEEKEERREARETRRDEERESRQNEHAALVKQLSTLSHDVDTLRAAVAAKGSDSSGGDGGGVSREELAALKSDITSKVGSKLEAFRASIAADKATFAEQMETAVKEVIVATSPQAKRNRGNSGSDGDSEPPVVSSGRGGRGGGGGGGRGRGGRGGRGSLPQPRSNQVTDQQRLRAEKEKKEAERIQREEADLARRRQEAEERKQRLQRQKDARERQERQSRDEEAKKEDERKAREADQANRRKQQQEEQQAKRKQAEERRKEEARIRQEQEKTEKEAQEKRRQQQAPREQRQQQQKSGGGGGGGSKLSSNPFVRNNSGAAVAAKADDCDWKCGVCGKRVYLTEKVAADGKIYHKTCMRCTECNCVLKLGNYASLKGQFFCKPHFKQLFKNKGNYDEGFGREQHKTNWKP
eukprot:TRINITY_DN3_c1_g3_i4.p1 TRINITY_DN3_c1_g3~~TRINITY_DN3_c1_g3_i4.p1  ORF type:complete len:696 (-),score=248.43 TRINITY_DN3_c1_g3_i4:347-2434(-)